MNSVRETVGTTSAGKRRTGGRTFLDHDMPEMTPEQRLQIECLIQRAREANRPVLSEKLRAYLNDDGEFELSPDEWIAAAENLIAR